MKVTVINPADTDQAKGKVPLGKVLSPQQNGLFPSVAKSSLLWYLAERCSEPSRRTPPPPEVGVTIF